MEQQSIPNHETLPGMPSATNPDHDGRYRTETELASNANAQGAAFIGIETGSGSPTVKQVQSYLDNTGSSGFFTGGILSDGGVGTLDVSAGEGFIRTSADDNAPLQSFKWSASAGIAVPDDTTRYVFVDDTGAISLDADEFSEAVDKIMLGVVTDEGGLISHTFNLGVRLEESIGQMGRYIRHVDGIVRNRRKGGLIFGHSGDVNRFVTVSTGQLEWGRTSYTIAAFNTSGADTFDTYSAGGQEATGVSAWPNTSYDNAGTLTTMTNNRWAVLWWYIEPDGHIVMLYGRAQYVTEGQAEDEEVPASSIPNRLSSASVIASKFIFQKGEDIPAKVETAFGTPFTGSGVTDHGNLAGLGDDDHTQYIKKDPGITYVFITGATGSGVISNKAFEANTIPANKVLDSFSSDNDDITINLEMHVLSNAWQPEDVIVSLPSATSATVTKDNWTQVDDSRVFTATANIADANTTGTITATMSDGDIATCDYTRELDPPLVLTAVIDNHSTTTGGDAHCPAAQTQVKENDTLDISGTTEAHADEVYVLDSDVTNGKGLQGPFAVVASAWSGTINVGSGTDATAIYVCYAKVTGGDAGANKNSTENVDLNQIIPTFSAAVITYPGTQLAIKDAETVTVTITHTNIEVGDTYLYSDNATGELTIPNTTTYVAGKANVARNVGDYRVSGTNYDLVITRTTKNGASATKNTTVKISNNAPTLTMTGATNRLRSQVGDSQSYPLLITSDFQLKAFDCERDGADDGPAFAGAWTGSGSGDTTWTENIFVEEDDTKNVGAAEHTYANILATGLSEKTTNTIGTNPNYTIGGFETRDVSFLAFEEYNAIGTMASNKDNANKITCEIVGVKGLTYVGNTTPAADKFTITDSGGTFDADGDYVRLLDADFIGLGLAYDLRIEEIV